MPKGRFCMGKCESGETSMNDLRGMVRTKKTRSDGLGGRRTMTAGKPSLLEILAATLQQIERAQIVARLIKAATAERPHKFAPVLQAFRIDFPISPGEEIVGKRKRARIFILEHRHRLISVPLMLRRKHRGSQHIEESVHFGFHFVAKLPDWMMQPGCKLDRELMRSCRYQRPCDLRRSWKCVGRHAAGAQFVTEFCRVLIGVVTGD